MGEHQQQEHAVAEGAGLQPSQRGCGRQPLEASPQQLRIGGGAEDTDSESRPGSPSDLEHMYAFSFDQPAVSSEAPAVPPQRRRKPQAAEPPSEEGASSAPCEACPATAASQTAADAAACDQRRPASRRDAQHKGERAHGDHQLLDLRALEIPTPMGKVPLGLGSQQRKAASAMDRAGTPVPTGKAHARRQGASEESDRQKQASFAFGAAAPGRGSAAGKKAGQEGPALFDTSGLHRGRGTGGARRPADSASKLSHESLKLDRGATSRVATRR